MSLDVGLLKLSQLILGEMGVESGPELLMSLLTESAGLAKVVIT